MRLFPHLKIAQKLPLVVLGAALVVGSAIAGASFYFAARALEDQARQNLATIAFERSNQLSTYLSALQSDVARLAKSEIGDPGASRLRDRVAADHQRRSRRPSCAKAYITDNPNAGGRAPAARQGGDGDELQRRRTAATSRSSASR